MNVYEEALIFATEAHQGQTRKFSPLPYIIHPLEVSTIIATLTEDLNVMSAGLLHDTIEDCGVDPLEIRRRFGPRVFQLVLSETEDKHPGKSEEETWQQRKEESLMVLEHTTDIDVKRLWLGDKLSNIRSFYRAFLLDGHKIWQTLHQKDPSKQAWYYRTIVKSLYELKDTAAYAELNYLIEEIFKGV